MPFFILLYFSGCQDHNKNFETSEISYTSSVIIKSTSENLIQSENTEQSTEALASEIALKNNMEVVSIVSDFAYEPRQLEETGGKQAARFISDKLIEYGWIVKSEDFYVYRYEDVMLYPYNLKSENAELLGTGTNIIAVAPNYNNEKETIILSAHYDTTKDNIGIIDNGSGTAFLISAAEVLSNANYDFNIILAFFDMEEYSMYGSKYYLENMAQEQRSKIIANINFDMLGGSSESLKIATSNGLESALEIYINSLCKNKFDKDFKGANSDSGSFMHWKIPAITFIDTSLPHESVENEKNIDLLSDKAFNAALNDLLNILNNFDIRAFVKIKSSCAETDYMDNVPQDLPKSEIYNKMLMINISDFQLVKCYTKVYENGLSSRLCCEYASNTGREFIVEGISDITEDTKLLNGIPDFEACLGVASDDNIFIDDFLKIKIIGEMSEDELKSIWEYLRGTPRIRLIASCIPSICC